jgi:hypothetical protein
LIIQALPAPQSALVEHDLPQALLATHFLVPSAVLAQEQSLPQLAYPPHWPVPWLQNVGALDGDLTEVEEVEDLEDMLGFSEDEDLAEMTAEASTNRATVAREMLKTGLLWCSSGEPRTQ